MTQQAHGFKQLIPIWWSCLEAAEPLVPSWWRCLKGCGTFGLQLVVLFQEAIEPWAGGTGAAGQNLGSALLPGFLQNRWFCTCSYCLFSV